MRRGASNDYGINSNSNMPAPFMNDHLRDLDKELELLKMKREMIEQQQQLLNQQMGYNDQRQQGSSVFGSHAFREERPNYKYDYSHLYDNDRTNDDYIPFSGQGRKRPSTGRWNESPPKRFSGPTRGPSKKPNTYRASAPARSAPKYSSKPKSLMDIKPAFPSKRRPNPVPKPSTAKPTNTSKAPVKASPKPSASTSVAPAKSTKPIEKEILKPDCEPSRSLNGRLELALGSLLKELKEKYSNMQPYVLNFRVQSLLKHMKTTIRQRIRETMLGKEVGNPDTILVEYRKKYPVASDLDIVNLCLNEHTDLGFKKHMITRLTLEETPELHFKENISLMIDYKLRKMFARLTEMYAKDYKRRVDTVELTMVHNPGAKPQSAVKDDDVEMKDDTTKTDDVAKEDDAGKKDDTAKESDAAAKDAEMQDDDVIEIKGDVIEIKDDEQAEKEYKVKVNLDQLIEKKLPGLLNKNVKHIISLLDFPSMYDLFKAEYVGKLNPNNRFNRFRKNVDKQEQSDDKDASMNTSDGSTPSTSEKKHFYNVKVLGRPRLPARAQMQEFFKEFEPKAIRRHKKINNLLVVGFHDMESVEKLLERDGTIINKMTLVIKHDHVPQQNGSAENVAKDENIKNEEESTKVEDDSANKSGTDSILCETIDNEITNLLDSINEAEQNTSQEIIEDCDNKEDAENTTENNDINETIPEKDEPEIPANDCGMNLEDIPEEDGHEENEGNDIDDNADAGTVEGDNKGESEVKEGNENVNKAPAKPAQGTPAKARVSTPMSIRTRRASRLQNN